MAMGEARAYAVGLLLFALGAVQLAAGGLDLLARPATVAATALAVGTVAVGLALLPAARYVAKRRKRGLALAIVGLSGVVVVHFGPLLAGDGTALSVGSVLAALVLMVYLLLHEDAFGDRPERELTEETNPHEFVR
ncbi:hypothetical protein [Haloarcula onubensis]|uniref:Integral membrane protein n=1 Tax=Haloarcula onubensis TaxID=2950539 RepID=A0ABU2FQL0_9EURY|nr:hypothetical protein [Halomicroarcula sp. S3CR25-11]MDS0283040.1 hypothetical protein [Halomicroarcula sp. S3CR25-11]